MKCIDKKGYFIVGLLLMILCMTGCGQEIVLENSYDTFSSTEKYGMTASANSQIISLFAQELCVGGTENSVDENVANEISEAAGLFNLEAYEVEYARNIHEKLYPASTTKILTAYVALKYGTITDTTEVSEKALQLEAGSSVSELSVGDKISLEQLLYGLLLSSGNDSANVIAEMISGSTEDFAALMNQEARKLGATESNFLNAHGLHDEQHYTTLYDLYLIFNTAIQNESFLKIINTESYTAEYQNNAGETVTKEWSNTNKYLIGETEAPEGITVIGGKTGTTNAAGHCLVLLSEKTNAKPYISIVLKSGSREDLYSQMTDLLEKATK